MPIHARHLRKLKSEKESFEESEKAKDMPKSQTIESHEGKKYLRKIHGASSQESVDVDVYEVLVAFGVTCHATAHAIKKLLCAGQRGKGTRTEDLVGAIAAINRAIEIEERSIGAVEARS